VSAKSSCLDLYVYLPVSTCTHSPAHTHTYALTVQEAAKHLPPEEFAAFMAKRVCVCVSVSVGGCVSVGVCVCVSVFLCFFLCAYACIDTENALNADLSTAYMYRVGRAKQPRCCIRTDRRIGSKYYISLS